MNVFGRRTMMKNLLIVFTVLAMASVANAALSLSLNGSTDIADSQAFVNVSEVATIDVHSVGEKAVWTNMVVIQGVAAPDLSNMWIVPLGIGELIIDVTDDEAFQGYVADLGYTDVVGITYSELVHASGTPMAIPDGAMIDGLKFHCEGLGDVIVSLLDGADGTLLDRMVIHQIPEPITFALLGLGGLFLRRRK
jgi:hypothetical protein